MSNQEFYGGGNSGGYYPSQPTYAQPQQHEQHDQHHHHHQHHHQQTYGQQHAYAHQQPGYPQQTTYAQQHGQQDHHAAPLPGGPDAERGLGATLVGGGGAVWAAHKAGGGFMGTAGAALAGAIGANVLEHALDKKKRRKKKKKKHGSRDLD